MSEMDEHGHKQITNVYAQGQIIAQQRRAEHQQNPTYQEQIMWRHTEPLTGSRRETYQTGVESYEMFGRRELDSFGNEMPLNNPHVGLEPAVTTVLGWDSNLDKTGNPLNPEAGGVWPDTGLPAPCTVLSYARNHGILEIGERFISVDYGRWKPMPADEHPEQGAHLWESMDPWAGPQWIPGNENEERSYGHYFAHGQQQGQKTTGPTEADKKCDQKLARLFTRTNTSIAAARYDPSTLKDRDGSPRYETLKDGEYLDRNPSGHAAPPHNEKTGTRDRGGIIHVYPNAQGIIKPKERVGVYLPQGYGFQRITSIGKQKLLPGGNNVQYFQSKTLGIYMTIAHSSTAGIRRGRVPDLVGYFSYDANGVDVDYIHVHISFFSEFTGDFNSGTRVDPRKYFCKEFGF